MKSLYLFLVGLIIPLIIANVAVLYTSPVTGEKFPYCHQCNVIYTDKEGDWGVENNEWCYILQGCNDIKTTTTTTTTTTTRKKPTSALQLSEFYGYPFCKHCVVAYTDSDGYEWGFKDHIWCIIDRSMGCNPEALRFYEVAPYVDGNW